MEDNVNGAELRDVLVPDYPIGAKRLLVSDDYYQSLNRDNVHLVTDVIDRVEKDAVVTADGKRHPADVLVMPDGSLLVADDAAGVIYRIAYDG